MLETLKRKQNGEQYSIYVFTKDSYKNSSALVNHWERARKTRHRILALRKARRLYDSNFYGRVEVRRQYIDSKSGLKRCDIYDVYDRKRLFFKRFKVLLGRLFHFAHRVFTNQ